MRGLLLSATVASLLAFSGCGTKAYTDFDPEARFDAYRTFAWLAPESEMAGALSDPLDPLLFRRIRVAIEDGLAARGFRQVAERESADFVVSFDVGSRERLQPQPQSHGRVGVGSYGSYGGWSVSAPVATQGYTEGTLSIDVFDGASRRPVWHGSASRQVTPSMDRAALVDDVVGAILAEFPPER